MKILRLRAMALSMAIATTGAASPVAATDKNDWQAANERVAKAGGWRAYARDTLPAASSPCLLAGAANGAGLTAPDAMAAAVAPRPWPPLAWQQADGSARRVAVDGELVTTAHKARGLWIAAVNAGAALQLAARHYDAVDAAADLATRLHAAGNLPRAEALHEQKARSEAAIGCLNAVRDYRKSRHALALHLNLDAAGAEALALPSSLPSLPAAAMSTPRLAELLARSSLARPNAPMAVRLAELEADYRHRWAVAKHHQNDILPLVETLREESVLRYNGMLIGPDELLKFAREALDAERAALAALAEFWHADTALQAALMGYPGD